MAIFLSDDTLETLRRGLSPPPAPAPDPELTRIGQGSGASPLTHLASPKAPPTLGNAQGLISQDLFASQSGATKRADGQYQLASGEVVAPWDPRVNPQTFVEQFRGSATPGGSPFDPYLQAAASKVPSNPVSRTLQKVPVLGHIASSRGVAGLASGVVDSALLGAPNAMGGGNTDVSDPRFWAEAAQSVGNTTLLRLGPQMSALGPMKSIAVGGATGGGLALTSDLASGDVNPRDVAAGTVLGAGLPLVGAGTGYLASRAGEAAPSAARVGQQLAQGETGSLKLPANNPADYRLKLKPGEAEQGVRKGELLNLRGDEQLPSIDSPDYYKKVINVASDAERQVSNQANVLRAQAEQALKPLGPIVKGDGQLGVGQGIQDANSYFRNIPQAPAEAALLGPKPGALVTRVLERPGEYPLTPAQQAAVAKMGAIEQAVAKERGIFNVAPDQIALDEGQQYIHRLALKPTEESQAAALVGGGNANLRGGAGGNTLRIGSDRTRIFADPAESVAKGAVYADPLTALDQNVSQGLRMAANAHIRDLLVPLSNTSADYVPEGLRVQWNAVKAELQSQAGKLATAEKRAGIAYGKAAELAQPIDRLGDMMPSTQAKAALKQAVSTMNQARQDALRTARAAGAGMQVDRAAQQALTAKLDEVVNTLASQSAAQPGEIRYALLKSLEGTPVEGAQNASISAYIRRAAKELEASGAAGKLRQADAAAILAAKDVAPEDAYVALRQMQRRADALSARGAKWSGLADSIQQSLAQMQAQYDELLPRWREAQDIARQRVGTAPGRATVPSNIATALQGRDFPQEVADKLTKFYGRNQPPAPGTQSRTFVQSIKSINSNLIPVKATWDASSTLMQQGRVAILHPVTFTKNLALSMRDLVNPEAFSRYLASGEADDAARSGVAIMGQAGKTSEFQFNNWFEHVPVLGKIASATNRQFNSFNTRQRVTIFNDYVKANERIGNTLDARAKEQLAVGLNRITGVSSSRAGDLEQLAEFAPNFVRSHIEAIGKAVADGSIEGQVARRELSTFFAFMSTAIGGIAVAQGRDPSEVLNPLDMKALERGEVRINPNFGTIRVSGEDINLYGPYLSLAKLASVAGNDIAHAGLSASQGDTNDAVMRLVAALGNATGTKGSPVAKFATDLANRETFTGEAPAAPLALLESAVPISIANIVQDRARGLSWHDTLMDAIAGAIGANANPTTPTERLSEAAGTDFNSLSPAEKQAVLDANPDLARQRIDQGSPEFKAAEEVKATIQRRQGAQDAAFLQGTMTLKQWKDLYHDNTLELNSRRDQVYASAGKQKGRDPVLDGYFKALDAATSPQTNIVDWQQVDAYRAKLTPEDNSYIDRNTGLALGDLPAVKQYRAAMVALRDAGYFDMPKYRGLVSGASDDTIDTLRQQVSAARAADPRLARADFNVVARRVLTAAGVPAAVIADVVRSGRQQNQNPAVAKFKASHPELVAWLEDQYTYPQLMAIAQRPKR